uniref:Uncharacterized protein n=1 Tax=Romanomermis culicivorax TaxID=13658 RepID=A0A915I101_ROMCU
MLCIMFEGWWVALGYSISHFTSVMYMKQSTKPREPTTSKKRKRDKKQTNSLIRNIRPLPILLSIVEGGGLKAQAPACSQQALESPLRVLSNYNVQIKTSDVKIYAKFGFSVEFYYRKAGVKRNLPLRTKMSKLQILFYFVLYKANTKKRKNII